jgi:hypothetical protein
VRLKEGAKVQRVTASDSSLRSSWSEATPEPYSIYYVIQKPPQPHRLEWIIQGTDSKLYVVPAYAGGWMLRSEYQGQVEQLTAVSQKKASSICWTVYGDVGRVTIEGANLESRWKAEDPTGPMNRISAKGGR